MQHPTANIAVAISNILAATDDDGDVDDDDKDSEAWLAMTLFQKSVAAIG